jgi:hypothetical protein
MLVFIITSVLLTDCLSQQKLLQLIQLKMFVLVYLAMVAWYKYV